MSTTTMPEPAPALVLFGRDEAGKPHAAWFDQASAALATKAAALMNMRAVPVETEPLRELATSLPKGRVFSSGRAFTPFIKAKLYERLAELTKDLAGLISNTASGTEAGRGPETAGDAQSGPAGGNSSASAEAPPVAKRPISPEQIGLSSTVLATTGPAEGWFEAEVMGLNGSMLTLKWADFPGEPSFVRRRHEVGFLPASR